MVVDEHADPPEGVDSGLNGMVCCTVISHIEGYGANPITVPLYQIGELRRVTRRSDEPMPCGEHRLGERPAHAASTTGHQPAFSNLLYEHRRLALSGQQLAHHDHRSQRKVD